LEFFLVLIYIVFFSYIILKTQVFKSKSLTKNYILAFFLIKVVAGFTYIYIHKNILVGGDIFAFFNDGKIVFSALKENPLTYLQLVFGPSDLRNVPTHLLPYTDSMGYWFDQGNYVMVRINALFHLFSFGYFSVHVVFISFLSLIGIYNIYRFFEPCFNGDKLFLVIFLFFTPSIVFWYSGMHKEAVVILALGFILNSYQHLISEEFKPRWIAAIILGTVLLTLVRFYVFAIFFPGLLALFLSYRLKKIPSLYLFTSIYILFMLAGIMLHFYNPNFSPFQEMMVRQQYFFNSPGNSSYTIPMLDGSVLNTLVNIPQALLNSLIHPVPKDCLTSSFLCFMAMIESYMILAVLIYAIFKIKWNRLMTNEIILYCLFSSISLLIIMGLVVNNAGALVRYKSVILPFLLIGVYLATRKQNYKLAHQ